MRHLPPLFRRVVHVLLLLLAGLALLIALRLLRWLALELILVALGLGAGWYLLEQRGRATADRSRPD
jgi:hypothetical protein